MTTRLIRWQKPMVAVLIACAPCVIGSVYRFGWRSAAVIATVAAAAFFAEWIFTHRRKEPVSSAVFVTALLLALTLPPTIPLWMAVVGALVGIVFGKELFGGFGRNIFNPALVGRCFIYVCFPVQMTGRWARPAGGGLAGFARWSTEQIDAVTGATPLDAFRGGVLTAHMDLLLGNRAGCLGETAAIAILLGAAYLLVRRVADYRLMVGAVGGALLLSGLFRALGLSGAPDPLWTVLAGGFLFGAVFMVTDPVSAARTPQGKWVSGLMVGFLTVLMRQFGVFPEGIMFAILLVNTFNPTIDLAVRALQPRKDAAA